MQTTDTTNSQTYETVNGRVTIHANQLLLVKGQKNLPTKLKRELYWGTADGPRIPESAHPRVVVVGFDGTHVRVNTHNFALEDAATLDAADVENGVVEPLTTTNGTPQWGY